MSEPIPQDDRDAISKAIIDAGNAATPEPHVFESNAPGSIGASCRHCFGLPTDPWHTLVIGSHVSPALTKPPRGCGLDTHDLHMLDFACTQVSAAFGFASVYLVGTAAVSHDYRDVDVRAIIDDDEFDALFATRPQLWGLLCLTVTRYLRSLTGLPVDFQVQRRTEANEKHEGVRIPLGKRPIDHFAGRGDATKWKDTPHD